MSGMKTLNRVNAEVQGRARVHFEAICEAAPLDKVAKVYLARVQAYQITGLPPHFDGDLGHM